jgi:hypothetical protein
MAVYIRGIRQLQSRIHELGESPKEILKEIQLETILRARDSVQVKSGATRNSIKAGGLTKTYARIVAGGAALYLEKGTRPHVIRPRTKGALFFPSQQAVTARFGPRARIGFTRHGLNARSTRRYGSGAYVLTKMVRHPGQAATPFLVPSAEDAVRNVSGREIIDAWNRGA